MGLGKQSRLETVRRIVSEFQNLGICARVSGGEYETGISHSFYLDVFDTEWDPTIQGIPEALKEREKKITDNEYTQLQTDLFSLVQTRSGLMDVQIGMPPAVLGQILKSGILGDFANHERVYFKPPASARYSSDAMRGSLDPLLVAKNLSTKDVFYWKRLARRLPTLDITKWVCQEAGLSSEELQFYANCFGIGDLAKTPILLGYFGVKYHPHTAAPMLRLRPVLPFFEDQRHQAAIKLCDLVLKEAAPTFNPFRDGATAFSGLDSRELTTALEPIRSSFFRCYGQ